MSEPPKILVVDDLVSARRVVRRLLERLGYRDIEESGSAEEALERIKGGTVRLVIADINMPRMNGIELLREIRKAHATLPFVMITSSFTDEALKDAEESGASQFLLKPFNSSELAAALTEALA